MEPVLDLCVDITAVSSEDPAHLQAQTSVYCEALNLRHDGEAFSYPLSQSEQNDLHWYLEEYWKWPYAGFAFRGAEVEHLLPELGQRLYQAVFGEGPAREIMQQWRSTTTSDHQVSIITTDPKALSLPWELLHDGQEFLAFQREPPVAVVRRLAAEQPLAARATFKKPLRVLIVTARPTDAPEVDARTIAHEVLNVLQDQIAAGALDLEFLRPPTLERLKERLQDKKRPVHILHFDGHGEFGTIPSLLGDVKMAGQILFENADGTSAPIMGKTLTNLLNEAGVQLAVLNACQSATIGTNDVSGSMAVELIRGGVKAVVAMSATVLAVSAAAYVRAFYGTLASGVSIQHAHEQAQHALRENPTRDPLQRHKNEMAQPVILHDWWLPNLYQGQPLSLQPLKARPRPKKPASALPRLSENMPAPPYYEFSGRGRELLDIERSLQQGKILVVTSFGGIGKTAVASEVSDWLTRTGMYDGACFVSFEHGGDASVLMSTLGKYLQINDGGYHPYDPPAALAYLAPLLKKKRFLLIADNVESILPGGDAPLDDAGRTQLWKTLSGLREKGSGVLITTRAPKLADRGFPPEMPVDYLELKGLASDDAHALAVHVLLAFEIDPAQIPYADRQELLNRLDHHPLAIQLVLPALAKLPPAKVLDDLTALLSVVPNQQATGRNRSLQASLDYSLQQLNAEQRALLPRLALFEGGALGNSILNVTQMSPVEWDTLRTALEQAALLTQEPIHPAMKAKFQHFHPALAPYLRGLPKADDVTLREKYIENYYQLANVLSTKDKENPDRIRAMAQREFPNMLSTLHMLFHTGDIELITAMADSLTRFLEYLGQWQERDALRLSVLAAIRPASVQSSGMLTWEIYWQEKSLGEQELEKGDWRAAVNCFQALLFAIEMLPEGEETGLHSMPHITTLQQLARGLKAGDQLDKAATRLKQAQAITSELLEKEKKEGQKNPDLKHLYGSLLADYGDVLRDQGIYDAAQQAYEEALGIAQEEKDQRNQAILLTQLGSLALRVDLYTEARKHYQKARKHLFTLNEQDLEATLWHQLGMAAVNESLDLQSKRLAQVNQGMANAPDTEAQEQALLEEAENDYRESLRLRDLLKDDRAAIGDCNQLGNLTERTGHYLEAKYWYEQALERIKRVSSGDPYHERCLCNLATLLTREYYPNRMAHLAEARMYAEEALAICETHPIEDETWKVFRVLAIVAELQERMDDAQHYRRRERGTFSDFPGHHDEILQQFGPFMAAVAIAASGDPQAQASVEILLAYFDRDNTLQPVAIAIRHLWEGERDWETLTREVDPQNALLLRLVLESLAPKKIS